MSMLNYNGPRRFPRPNSARTFPETYYNERHPYSYPMGGPVSGLRARASLDEDEFQSEQGGTRRRIAVACARCRKRKIRCSGDSQDGGGCANCKAAGVDASHCQFHRVGSDHVQKVMDNYTIVQSLANMATAHTMVPQYANISNGPYNRNLQSHEYPQPETKFSYPQMITKSVYNSDWPNPYEDNTPPIDNYSYDQSQTYVPSTPVQTASSLCGLSYRWASQNSRTNQPATSYYSDYGHSYVSNDVPYLQTDMASVGPVEPVSPLNMSSLQLTLPERPRQRQMQPVEVPLTPRRRLPAPQPKPGHGLHHALDHQQDQRLRSSQTIGTPLFRSVSSSYASTGSFAKPLLPWETANENLMNAVNEVSSVVKSSPTTPQVSVAGANNSVAFPTGTSTNAISGTSTPSSNELNFATLPLLDPSMMMEPSVPYSNFRESQESGAKDTQLPRNNSTPSLYVFDDPSRRPSFVGSGSLGTLVSGHRYTPLKQSDGNSSMDAYKKAFEARNPPLHRASTSDLASGY
ncbi:hypothetical protein C7974DRAFT_352430 [Boeremia exigua]|uniref:uncharacterized protein n=1 Tax=Boeremia exigua TaxID=749465 RepID=UPI001E8DE145|nr:uncharacterized protein C7974DRAFT_352430 [Boeremia exigua]KAH6643165.1 hypothetical protein C7974DRAFT_352430 [Boeremia exigua]